VTLKQLRDGYWIPMALLVVALLVYGGHSGVRGEINAAVGLAARADIGPMVDYLIGFGWWAPVISALLQIVTSIFAPLPSFMLAFANAMLFGVWWGALLTWSSALLAAAICFAIARGFGRPAVERFVPFGALETMDRFFSRHGVLAVVVARVVPFFNPDVVSYAAGLTPMRWRLFMLSIGIGALPSTALYSFLGGRGITTVGWLFGPLMALGVLTFALALLHRYRENVLPQPAPSPRHSSAE
jgi:uncharacterized membrane protein YdjX (TVP38/TMEM64 family)